MHSRQIIAPLYIRDLERRIRTEQVLPFSWYQRAAYKSHVFDATRPISFPLWIKLHRPEHSRMVSVSSFQKYFGNFSIRTGSQKAGDPILLAKVSVEKVLMPIPEASPPIQ